VKKGHKVRQIVDKANSKAKKLKPKCFFSSCNELAINSHSQSMGRSLRNISVDGKVIGLDINPFDSPADVNDWFKEIGIRQASRFKGFCQKHDDEFFKAVDSFGVDDVGKKTLARLAFRTFAMEVRIKEQAFCMVSTIIKRIACLGLPFPDDLYYFNLGREYFLKNDVPYYLNKFETMLDLNNYHDVESAVFMLNRNIGISCSTCINPSNLAWLSEKNHDYKNLENPLPVVFFTVVPGSSETMVVFTYFMNDKPLVINFIREHDRLEEIVFNYCEEVLFNPDFFNSLADDEKRKIVDALTQWIVWEKVLFPDLFKVNLTSPNYY